MNERTNEKMIKSNSLFYNRKYSQQQTTFGTNFAKLFHHLWRPSQTIRTEGRGHLNSFWLRMCHPSFKANPYHFCTNFLKKYTKLVSISQTFIHELVLFYQKRHNNLFFVSRLQKYSPSYKVMKINTVILSKLKNTIPFAMTRP